MRLKRWWWEEEEEFEVDAASPYDKQQAPPSGSDRGWGSAPGAPLVTQGAGWQPGKTCGFYGCQELATTTDELCGWHAAQVVGGVDDVSVVEFDDEEASVPSRPRREFVGPEMEVDASGETLAYRQAVIERRRGCVTCMEEGYIGAHLEEKCSDCDGTGSRIGFGRMQEMDPWDADVDDEDYVAAWDHRGAAPLEEVLAAERGQHSNVDADGDRGVVSLDELLAERCAQEQRDLLHEDARLVETESELSLNEVLARSWERSLGLEVGTLEPRGGDRGEDEDEEEIAGDEVVGETDVDESDVDRVVGLVDEGADDGLDDGEMELDDGGVDADGEGSADGAADAAGDAGADSGSDSGNDSGGADGGAA